MEYNLNLRQPCVFGHTKSSSWKQALLNPPSLDLLTDDYPMLAISIIQLESMAILFEQLKYICAV